MESSAARRDNQPNVVVPGMGNYADGHLILAVGPWLEMTRARGRDAFRRRARAAADELSGFADRLDAPVLRASAAHARGAVLLAEGTPHEPAAGGEA
jgi:hypothetical protein